MSGWNGSDGSALGVREEKDSRSIPQLMVVDSLEEESLPISLHLSSLQLVFSLPPLLRFHFAVSVLPGHWHHLSGWQLRKTSLFQPLSLGKKDPAALKGGGLPGAARWSSKCLFLVISTEDPCGLIW